MSLGYADRLKPKRNLGGQLGAQEYHQSIDDIAAGVENLATWVAESKRIFIFTGAGISTSCGIPDFRGPKGIWTLRKKKAPLPTDFTPFEYAKPSFTHMAIAALVACGKAPYVCSQNVDSMHLWSGVPRAQLAELHGNCFAERCTRCRREYARDFQMETVNFQPTGRRCADPGCGGELADNILDWDTALPQDELDASVQAAEDADLALVLGTSLQIQPANEIPVLTRDEGGKMVIVNMQKTPKDRRANLILRARVDLVMALLMQRLGMQVPPFVRRETLVVEHAVTERIEAEGGGQGGERTLSVTVCSRHGRECPLPMVESLRISVAAAVGDAEGAGPEAATGSGGGSAGAWGPCSSGELTSSSSGALTHAFHVPGWVREVRCTLDVRLVKHADPDKRDVTLQHCLRLGKASSSPPEPVDGSALGEPAASSSGVHSRETHSFTSQEVNYDAAQVVASFQASPPPVVVPETRRKKAKVSDEAAPTDSAVPQQPLRRSARQQRSSSEAAMQSNGSSSQDD